MQRSSSSGSLRAAGVLTHVPKRAVQHGMFLSSAEVAPTDLKPGQFSLTRQVYSEEAAPHHETYLNPDRPHDSHYAQNTSKLLSPQAYKSPTQKIIPQEAPPGNGHHGTAHWKSTMHSNHNPESIAGAVHHRQGPPGNMAPPSCVSAADTVTSYHEFHGKYGTDPRDKLGHPHVESMPFHRSVLHEGTHKGTKHIAGYQGFAPKNIANPHVARVHGGTDYRSVDKTNLTQVFHTNLLNYSGHVATNARNDRGGVKPNMQSSMGRSFTAPMLHAFE